jgi:hypothetical protein
MRNRFGVAAPPTGYGRTSLVDQMLSRLGPAVPGVSSSRRISRREAALIASILGISSSERVQGSGDRTKNAAHAFALFEATQAHAN